MVSKAVQEGFFATTRPLTGWLVRLGVRPNVLTLAGFAVVIASAVAFGVGAVRLGGGLLLLSGVIDTLDGQVARQTGTVTSFGAFFDSMLDRIGDGATFIGIGAYFFATPDLAFREASVVICMLAVVAVTLVSYARARAEGLGVDCRVGLIQRAERLIGVGLPTVLIGAGPKGIVLQVVVAVLTVLSFVTVIQRFVYVYRVTDGRGDR